MDEQIELRLTHIHWATYLYNNSISELQIISDEIYSKEELGIVNSHTFDFYRITLQYCFIMEYCKLLERGSKGNTQNISSLKRLNEIILEDGTKNFQKLYEQNNEVLDEIWGSSFYEKIKTLRNKKFAHADVDEINKPFSIKGFRTDDFLNAFKHLEMIKIIFHNFGSIYERTYDLEIPSREDRTKNFIKFHAKYEHYYMMNFVAAEMDRLGPQNGS